MICEDKFDYSRHPCTKPARYLVIVPSAPQLVCGLHARRYLKQALIPLSIFAKDTKTLDSPRKIELLKNVTGFLREMGEMGFEVSVDGRTIVIRAGEYSNENLAV